MREIIYEVLENKEQSRLEKTYNTLMLVTIIVSLLPLISKENHPLFQFVDILTTGIFIIDYALRWSTADFLLKRGRWSFVYYPFTSLAVIDLVSILPTFFILNASLRLLKVIRMGRLLRMFRFIRHSKNLQIVLKVIQQQKDALVLVGSLAIGYIFLVALIIFNVEPDTFPTFFDAVYWSTISLTTVGYGDIFAVSTLGKVITMVSSVLGVAVVALPAGIITAGYMNIITNNKD